jgi:hypothetical protein
MCADWFLDKHFLESFMNYRLIITGTLLIQCHYCFASAIDSFLNCLSLIRCRGKKHQHAQCYWLFKVKFSIKALILHFIRAQYRVTTRTRTHLISWASKNKSTYFVRLRSDYLPSKLKF